MNRTTLGPTGTPRSRQTSTVLAWILPHLLRVLLVNLAGGELTGAAIARGLGLSERTLHRRLRAESTSFADILDATRGELAKSLLPEPEIGIGEIAFLLGYSEPSAFHRFFRRWTGSTPLAYRRAARSA